MRGPRALVGLGLACATLALALAAAGVLAQDGPTVIQTNSGSVQGTVTSWMGVTARAWLGIPYGQAPIDDLRFQAPLAAEPWEDTLNATVAGAGCQQQCSLPPGLCPPVISEDCLFLNVFAPMSTPSEPRPVMVFIHGGNFRQGSGSTGMYDGTVFVNTSEVILVTMNYRLGALGFFFNANSTANNGMLDQQLAMQWVQTNIAAFGGNPQQVTIFGQSAGGTSIGCHLQNEVSLGLFQQAIIESIPLGIPVRGPADAEALNALFAKALNCAIDDIACLQAASVDDIFVAQKTAAAGLGPDWHHLLEIAQPWEPTLQQSSFPIALPLTQFFQQYPGKIPLMMGTTSQEAYVFIYEAINTTMGIVKAAAIETVVFGLTNLPGLESRWPLHVLTDNRPPLSDVAGDELFLCAARNATDGIVASAPEMPLYLYLFDHVSTDGSHGWGPDYPICWTHVCHGSEVPYVFGSAEAGGSTFSPDELALSAAMTTYWTNFATTGNPNKGQSVAVQWPQRGSARQTLQFATNNITVLEDVRGDKCDFLDTIGYTL